MNGTGSFNDIADEMPIFSNNHPLTFYSPTHCIFTLSLYIHPLTLQSHIHSIFTQSLCIHQIAVYSPTLSIFTHSLYIHLLTLYSVYQIHCWSEDQHQPEIEIVNLFIQQIFCPNFSQYVNPQYLWNVHMGQWVKSELTDIWSVLVSSLCLLLNLLTH